MKTKTKHTLGKCRVRESAQVYVDGRHVADCNAKDQREVATLHIKLEDEANAERIAHCWNCHDDLLDALKRLMTWVDPYAVPNCGSNDKDYEAARAAIAKAEGLQYESQ